jgi:hypothetical protein
VDIVFILLIVALYIATHLVALGISRLVETSK